MPVGLVLALNSSMSSEGVRQLLRSEPGFVIVEDCRDGPETVAMAVAAAEADVLLIERNLDGADGLQVLQAIRQPAAARVPPVVLIEAVYHDGDVVRAARAGVRGLVLKEQEQWALGAVIEAVARGGGWLSPAAARDALGLLQHRDTVLVDHGLTNGGITAREKGVMRLVAEGCSNTQIAKRLHLSESTVRTHISRLLGKLEVSTRAQLAVLAVRGGIY